MAATSMCASAWPPPDSEAPWAAEAAPLQPAQHTLLSHTFVHSFVQHATLKRYNAFTGSFLLKYIHKVSTIDVLCELFQNAQDRLDTLAVGISI